MPLVGTWIEIAGTWGGSGRLSVVPLVGTWIEIGIVQQLRNHHNVVPLVGTWIEIVIMCGHFLGASRAPRGHVD